MSFMSWLKLRRNQNLNIRIQRSPQNPNKRNVSAGNSTTTTTTPQHTNELDAAAGNSATATTTPIISPASSTLSKTTTSAPGPLISSTPTTSSSLTSISSAPSFMTTASCSLTSISSAPGTRTSSTRSSFMTSSSVLITTVTTNANGFSVTVVSTSTVKEMTKVTSSAPADSPSPPSTRSPTPGLTPQLHHPPAGAIAGGVISGLIIMSSCVLLFCALRRRMRKQHESEPYPGSFDYAYVGIHASNNASSTHVGDCQQPVCLPPSPALVSTHDFTHGDHSVSESPNTSLKKLQPDDSMSSWAAADMGRQNEILLRENEEFWDEIEHLRREKEEVRLRDGNNLQGDIGDQLSELDHSMGRAF